MHSLLNAIYAIADKHDLAEKALRFPLTRTKKWLVFSKRLIKTTCFPKNKSRLTNSAEPLGLHAAKRNIQKGTSPSYHRLVLFRPHEETLHGSRNPVNQWLNPLIHCYLPSPQQTLWLDIMLLSHWCSLASQTLIGKILGLV
jgi:hypothetical protein